LNSAGYGINASGEVTGVSTTTGGTTHAFLYNGSTMIDLGTLGGTGSYGAGINASGEVTGESEVTGNAFSHAFLYNGSTMIDLGTLGGMNSSGAGINASGEVVGYSDITGGSAHAFLYDDGTMYDLNNLVPGGLSGGAYLEYGIGINDNGWIVADGSNSEWYLLEPNTSPVPEPTSLPLLATGVGLLALPRMRKRRTPA
jgi:probable HAF family extracellular repeat protein